MNRQHAKTERPKRRGIWEKFFSSTLGNCMKLIGWAFLAVFASIVIEWIGMVFFWELNHAEIILKKEVGYLSQFNKNLITGIYPADIANFFLEWTQWFVEATGLESLSAAASSASMSFMSTIGHAAAAVVNITFLFAVRMAITVSAIPGLIVVLIVATIDGLTQRQIRRECGGNESALVYHSAKGWIWPIFILCSGAYLTLPISINPTLIFLPMMLIIGMLVYLTASRFKKFL